MTFLLTLVTCVAVLVALIEHDDALYYKEEHRRAYQRVAEQEEELANLRVDRAVLVDHHERFLAKLHEIIRAKDQ